MSYKKLQNADFIYAIYQNGYIKVGKTKNITARLAQYKRLGSLEVIGMARVVDMHSEEKELLQKCGKPIQKREYFEDNEQIRTLLKDEFALRTKYIL